MRFSNSRDADCSPPTSAGPIPAGVTLYFIMQSPVSPLLARLQPALGPARSSECTGLRFLYEHIVDVTLTCMAGLFLGSPPHLHRLLAASIPPSPAHMSSAASLCFHPSLCHLVCPSPPFSFTPSPHNPPLFSPQHLPSLHLSNHLILSPPDSRSPSLCILPSQSPCHTHAHTHISSRWFLRLLLLLRNAAPQCVDVIITQHPLLLWNTDEQQGLRQQRSNRQACEKNNHMLCGSRASRMTRIFTFFHRADFLFCRLLCLHLSAQLFGDTDKVKPRSHMSLNPNLFYMHDTRYS